MERTSKEMAEPQYKTQITARNLTLYSFLLTTLLLCPFASAQESTPNIETVIKHIDQLYRSETSHADMEMHIVTPHWERTLAMTIWSKGMSKTFIRITAPKKEQGVATLRIGNEMWNYLPKTNKVMKIPPSMMMGSWMGSDFTNDDLVRESSMLNVCYTRRRVSRSLLHSTHTQRGFSDCLGENCCSSSIQRLYTCMATLL